ncbi:MAG: hypothetical protein IV100_00265 [Myxococcales bacterium]|nr:hypothetical protein [Myxococcales bacterium]
MVRLVEATFVAITGAGSEFEATGLFERPELPWARLRAALVAGGLATGDPRELRVGTDALARVTRNDAGWHVRLQTSKNG